MPEFMQDPIGWYNQGRLPDEGSMRKRDLLRNDWAQRQRTKGAGKGSWNPLRGMPGYGKLMKGKAMPGGFQTGPTPAVRQFVERGPGAAAANIFRYKLLEALIKSAGRSKMPRMSRNLLGKNAPVYKTPYNQ
jgi:hypothetical protein